VKKWAVGKGKGIKGWGGVCPMDGWVGVHQALLSPLSSPPLQPRRAAAAIPYYHSVSPHHAAAPASTITIALPQGPGPPAYYHLCGA